ncbi:hypothetical protein C8F04DRAFT_1392356 [Mycena alexandri]|uniref:40S ribosomal protein S14 n=1 Tax=Mycena alexandri TaxID=1745969 RepID=A0AAD6T771_9AGAR|nr:hypothetical protein C8F04DRAFT_1392356 [Mycena alexandri]
MLEAIELAGLRAHIWGPVSWVQVLGFGREGEKSQGAQGGERVPRSQAERERVFAIGVAHIFASFNDTFVHVTDMSGKEAISLGMNVKVFASESPPSTSKFAKPTPRPPAPEARALRALARDGMSIDRIEDVTSVAISGQVRPPTSCTPAWTSHRKGGKPYIHAEYHIHAEVRRLSGTIAGVSSFNEPTAAFIAYGPDKRGGESHTISEKGCIFSGTIGIADVVSSMAAPSLGRYRESRPPAESSLTLSPVTVIPPGRAKFSRLPRQPVWCAHPCVPACAYRRQRLHIDADGQDGRASPTTSAVEIDRVVDDARFTKDETVAARITYKNALECRMPLPP